MVAAEEKLHNVNSKDDPNCGLEAKHLQLSCWIHHHDQFWIC